MKAPSEEIYSKSTICDFLLMVLIVTVAAYLRFANCEIFSGVEVENRHFCPLYCDCRPPSGGTPSNINVIYASLKSIFSGLQFCRRQYRSIFIRFAVVSSQICEITRNSEKIRTNSSSRSSKVINLGANRKRICNFLLVINTRISYRFRDIDA